MSQGEPAKAWLALARAEYRHTSPARTPIVLCASRVTATSGHGRKARPIVSDRLIMTRALSRLAVA